MVVLTVVDLMKGAIPLPETQPELGTIVYTSADGQQGEIEIIAGRVLVLFTQFVSETSAENLIAINSGRVIARIPSVGFYVVEVGPGSEMEFITRMRSEETVLFVNPDLPLKPTSVLILNEWDGIFDL
jgi:hypothetical protein